MEISSEWGFAALPFAAFKEEKLEENDEKSVGCAVELFCVIIVIMSPLSSVSSLCCRVGITTDSTIQQQDKW